MGAYPFGEQNVLVLFARSRGVLGVVGLATRVGYRVRQVIAAGVQLIQHFLGAIHDPNGFAAPFDGEQHAGFKLGNIHFNGRAGGFRPLAGEHAEYKGANGCHGADSAYRRRCPDQKAPLFGIC